MDIRLTAVRLPEDISDEAYERMLKYLPLRRRKRVMDMSERKNGFGALFSYALLRRELLRSFGIERRPVFAYGEVGKPYFPELSEIGFSLSDTRTHALCAVHSRPIGADVDFIRRIPPALLKKSLTDGEREYVGEDAGRFFRIWTLKESYVKLTGTGLTVPLRDIEFSMEGDRALGVNKEGIFVRSYALEECMAAVCASEEPPEEIELVPAEELTSR